MAEQQTRVLVLGSGGREHALCWKLGQEDGAQVWCAPGSNGIAAHAHCVPCALDGMAVVALAQKLAIDLVVVGPEAPLMAGVVDALEDAGIAACGPRQNAALLEGSKAFAKDMMQRANIPTAAFHTFDRAEDAEAHIRRTGQAWVVKADGLAAGKGVIVSESADEALAAVDRIMRHGAFGPAGTRVVLEERLEGEEISVHALVHGQSFQILGTAQDHKRLQDGDAGPNTGGMGAYTPPPVCDPALEARIERDIIAPILQEMCAAGRPLQGILFCGLMVQDAVPKVLEFNTRFGDPECQALLMRLESPLLPLLLSTAGRGKPLSEHTLCWRAPAALAVVLAAAGYPQSPVCGARINGLDQLATGNHLQVFHAGTRKRAAGDFETAGGRVLAVTASGDSVEAAANLAYRAVDTVHFDGKQWRRDIGWRALSCDRQKHVGPR